MTAVRCSLLSLLAAAAICAPATSSILRVKSDAPGPAHDGTTWATAFLKVQDAVTSAHSGDEVWVAAGTYVENVQISAATPVSLYGGFGGTETVRSQRYLGPSVTILDGGGLATVVAIRAAGVTVDGFTIRNGGGSPPYSGDPHVLELQGSGIACAADNLVVAHNVITGNTSSGGDGLFPQAGDGAGVFCSGNNALVDGNVISGNQARGSLSISFGFPGYARSASGAGVYLSGMGAVIRGNTITDNTISFSEAEPSPQGLGFRDDLTALGGGIYCTQAAITKNIIARNAVTGVSWYRMSSGAVSGTGEAGGGGIYSTGACTISGNLIYGNSIFNNSAGSGGGVYCEGASALTNNTVANNQRLYTLGSPYADDYVATSGARTNNIFGLYPDPQFVNAAAGDYHLQRTSPMVDAGDDSVVQPGDTDLDGNPRIRGAHVDMGAYELGPPLRVKRNAPGPTHDGATWDTAYLTVASALAASYPGDEIWVAAGYYPGGVTLQAGRSILGGFAGTETSVDQRNPVANVCVMDGQGRQGAVVAVMTKGDETAVVDGMTLQGGTGYWTETVGHLQNPLPGQPEWYYDDFHPGGGVYINGGAPRISNNRIVNNDCSYSDIFQGGSGAYFVHGGDGGGICTSGNAVIYHNSISGNVAQGGGGIAVYGGNPTITSNTITGNHSIGGAPGIGSSGGGIYVRGGNPAIAFNTISANESSNGYGGGVDLGGSATLNDNLITGNSSYNGGGGGVSLRGMSSLLRNTITLNSSHGAYGYGGGVWGSDSVTVADNLITGNSAEQQGGGIVVFNSAYSTDSGVASIRNNTVVGNTAAGGGGGCAIANLNTTTAPMASLVNNILASNGSGVYASATAAPTFSHNCVYLNTAYDYQGVADPTGTKGNIRVNPQFKDAANKDYHIVPGSQCIDAGDDSAATPTDTDLDGNPRIIGVHVDIGAYEYPSMSRVYVNCNATGPVFSGTSWGTAFQKIQDGISAVNPGGQVWVAKGTYVGNGLQVKPNVTLLGGFAGTESLVAQRDSRTNATILDGNADSSGYAPAPILNVLGGGVTVDGFTFRNGSEFAGPGSTGIPGAAIRYGNYPGRADAITISHNDIGSCNGSGIYCGAGSVPTIAWNKIQNNTGASEGGGIRLNGSTATIRDNLITGNSATSQAGGIRVYSSSATVANNTIVNSPDSSGIGIASFGQPVVFSNNIIAYNAGGVGLDAGSATSVTLRNNDVYGSTSWNYYGITDPTGANGNISLNPMFLNRASGDFHLVEGSFCVDGGNDSAVLTGDTDLDGYSRIIGAHVDMGCYEFFTAGTVTIADAAAVLRVAAGIWYGTPESMSRLNLDKNGVLDILDAVMLLRMADSLG